MSSDNVWKDQILVGQAHTWGWGDTEVREQLAAALEQARQEAQ